MTWTQAKALWDQCLEGKQGLFMGLVNNKYAPLKAEDKGQPLFLKSGNEAELSDWWKKAKQNFCQPWPGSMAYMKFWSLRARKS